VVIAAPAPEVLVLAQALRATLRLGVAELGERDAELLGQLPDEPTGRREHGPLG
jgi:hypothetical protein